MHHCVAATIDTPFTHNTDEPRALRPVLVYSISERTFGNRKRAAAEVRRGPDFSLRSVRRGRSGL